MPWLAKIAQAVHRRHIAQLHGQLLRPGALRIGQLDILLLRGYRRFVSYLGLLQCGDLLAMLILHQAQRGLSLEKRAIVFLD